MYEAKLCNVFVPSCRATHNTCLLAVKFSEPESEKPFLCPDATVSDMLGVFVSKYLQICSKLALLVVYNRIAEVAQY